MMNSRDKRRSTRLPLELEVCLISHDGILHHAVTANLSLTGLYLQPSPLLIPRHHPAQINLQLEGRRYHIPAMVVHQGGNGMGLTFNRPEHTLYLEVCDQLSRRKYDHLELDLSQELSIPA